MVYGAVTKLVGNGQSASCFFDPWLPGGRVIDRIGRSGFIQLGSCFETAGSFMDNEHWQLPPPLTSGMDAVCKVIKDI